MTRRVGGFLLTVGETCWWHWPDVFPVDDPVAVLVHCHTPILYRAVVAWYYVAPSVGVSITGQVMIAASRIWFARRGGRLPLPVLAAFASRRRARPRGIGKMKRDHLPACCVEIGRPIDHQMAPALEQVRPGVDRLDLIPDDMGQRRLDDLARMVRLLGRPVPERRAEPVRPSRNKCKSFILRCLLYTLGSQFPRCTPLPERESTKLPKPSTDSSARSSERSTPPSMGLRADGRSASASCCQTCFRHDTNAYPFRQYSP